jgi:NAD(P)-dependent dehydrogenase (short-subunit alcohol dehydrogenase family)
MKTSIVWGASGGVGRAMTAALAEAGGHVVAVSRHPDDLADLTPYRVEADVADADAVQRAVLEATMLVDDPFDLCVYAAGDIAAAKVGDMAPADWRRILSANLDGAYHVAHHMAPHLAEEGHLVLLGAISERLRLPGLAAYAAAKAGLEALAATLGKEDRRRRVTLVRPAAIATGLWDKVPLRLPEGAPPPEKVVGRILDAHRSGHKGVLELA